MKTLRICYWRIRVCLSAKHRFIFCPVFRHVLGTAQRGSGGRELLFKVKEADRHLISPCTLLHLLHRVVHFCAVAVLFGVTNRIYKCVCMKNRAPKFTYVRNVLECNISFLTHTHIHTHTHTHTHL